MARVQLKKAAKDYPEHGIAKGDSYYFCQLKTGARSSRIIRSKNPIPRSQTTVSAFYSQLWDIEDNALDSAEGPEALREAAERIRELGQEAQDSLDNMPEGLQQGSTGELLQERIDGCESWADEIERAADELEDELSTFDDAVTAYRSYLDGEKADYDNAMSEYDPDDPDAVEPVEPDEPDLPEGLSSEEVGDDDRVSEARQALIDSRVEDANSANPGL